MIMIMLSIMIKDINSLLLQVECFVHAMPTISLLIDGSTSIVTRVNYEYYLSLLFTLFLVFLEKKCIPDSDVNKIIIIIMSLLIITALIWIALLKKVFDTNSRKMKSGEFSRTAH